MTTHLTLAAVGDVFLNRPDPASAFAFVEPLFRDADVLFGNCEGVFTDEPRSFPTVGVFQMIAARANAAGLEQAGFDVLSCANNHACDAGHEALLDMLDMFRAGRMAPVGAGRTLAEARSPVVLTRNNLRIAFLAFTAVFPGGFEAKERTPGVAALRVHTHYFVHPEAFGRTEPGADPQIRTFPFPEDLDTITRAVHRARAQADLVVVSMHWGKSTRPALLTDYERTCGHAIIEAGADVIFGHHHHFLRGIEIHRGKPIFYGLGHFAFDMPGLETRLSSAQIEKLRSFGEYAIYPRPDYPALPFHPDSRMTMIGFCGIEDGAIKEVGFVPCLINPANQPVPLSLKSPEGARVAAYVRDISREAALETQYVEAGDMLGSFPVIVARAPAREQLEEEKA